MIIWTIMYFSPKWLRTERMNTALCFGTTEILAEIWLVLILLGVF